MLVYPAVFKKGEKEYTVLFPDVPEAITQGKSIEEAYQMAEEVLGLALENQIKFPSASSVEDIQRQFPNHIVALIGFDLSSYQRKHHDNTIQKNIIVPEWLNDLAEKEQINFSQTLTEALKKKLNV